MQFVYVISEDQIIHSLGNTTKSDLAKLNLLSCQELTLFSLFNLTGTDTQLKEICMCVCFSGITVSSPWETS